MPGGLPGGGGMWKLRFDWYISSCFLLVMQKKNNWEPREKCYTISFRLFTGSYGFAGLSVTTVFLQIWDFFG